MHKRAVHFVFIITLTARIYLFDTSNIIASITAILDPLQSLTNLYIYYPHALSHWLAIFSIQLVLVTPFFIHSCSLTCSGILLEDEDDKISFKCWNH